MVHAFIFVTVTPGKVKEVLEKVINLKNVARAFAVTGPYDLIVEVNASSIDEIGKSVVSNIQAISGVERTLTSIVVEI
jgi:DNA-binding Lrp family transcriptional regulator